MKLKGRSTVETVKREISAWERSQILTVHVSVIPPFSLLTTLYLIYR